jgi:hypothetical protein
VRFWRRGDQGRAPAAARHGGVSVDEPDDLTDAEDGGELAGTDAQAGTAGGGRQAGGPVLLTLTTREQVEKTTAPKMVRVRPGRGAFGGAASSGDACGPGCSH